MVKCRKAAPADKNEEQHINTPPAASAGKAHIASAA
jgi:hypothetical protein